MSGSVVLITPQAVLEYILSLDHYPTSAEILNDFGLKNMKETSKALRILKKKNKIYIDGEGEILVVAITNPKLQKLVDESVRIR